MSVRSAVESFAPEIPRGEAMRLLRMHRGTREPRESVMRCFEEEHAAARDLAEPRAVWTVVEGGIAGSAAIATPGPLAVAVCTIGPALEVRAAAHARAGDSLRAMILDALGSAAAEATADHCNGRICDRALREGLSPDRRRSPGYGSWDVAEQRLLFAQVDAGGIGVTLTEAGMMVPAKSVSFVVPLTGGKPGVRSGGRCSRCGFLACEYREA